MATENKQLLQNGLWHNNPALVQLLGLCPLLAVSNTTINGLALGLATTVTLVVANTLVSLTRHRVLHEIRIPVFILLIAGIVTVIDLLMNALLHQLYLNLGLFIPLIVTNCVILARAESFASRRPLRPSIIDGVAMGTGFSLVLLTLGAIRELLGTGWLLSDAQLLFGDIAQHWPMQVSADYPGLLLAILPPGAFILLGLLVACKNLLQQRAAHTAIARENRAGL